MTGEPPDQLALPTGQPRKCPMCDGAGVHPRRDEICPRCLGKGTVPDPATTMFPDGY